MGSSGDTSPALWRVIGGALIVAASLALMFACSAPPAVAPLPDPIVVVSDLDNMPFAGVDAEGRPVGRDVEMMEALGAAIGRPVQWRRQAFETLLPAVQANLVDAACATLGVTPERAERVGFTAPYFETVVTVVVRAGDREPKRWADLDGLRVAAGVGTTSERAVRRVLPRAIAVIENKDGLTSAERLLVGEVDGVAMDGPAAAAMVASAPGALTTLTAPLTAERYAIAVRPDDPELLRALDGALAEMRRTGALAVLDARWKLESADG